MAQLGGLKQGELSSVAPVRPPFQPFATCNFASTSRLPELNPVRSCLAQAEASVDPAQNLSANSSAGGQSANSANAAGTVVAAEGNHSSTSAEWPHDKCLDLQNELRTRMRELQSRALKAEAKVEQLERDLTAQQKAVPKPDEGVAATDKDIAQGTRQIMGKIDLLQKELRTLAAEQQEHFAYY